MNTLLSPIKEEQQRDSIIDKPSQVTKMSYCNNEEQKLRKSTSTLLTDSMTQLNIVQDEKIGRLSYKKTSKALKRKLVL